MIKSSPKKYIVLMVAGQKPTIPNPPNLIPVSLGWISTDILIGQWSYNVPDKKWYTRTSSGIEEVNDERFEDIGNSLTEVYNYINGLSGGLLSYFELVNEGLTTEYLRLKKPLACDYEISAWTNTGWLPPTIWESMPLASSTTYGAMKYNSSQFGLNGSNQLTLLDGVITPIEHTHSWDDITSGVPTEFNPSTHGLISDKHTVSGLNEGHFLRAITATSYGFLPLTKQDVTSVLSDWFELAGTAPNQYIRCKYPFGCDYEVQAYTGGSWLPPNIWAGIPIASASVLGAVKIGTGVAVASDGTISVATGAGMVYPAAGIPVSTGTAWAASIANNSANWNTAYSWGNHAGLYAPIGTVSSQWVTSGSDIYYNSGNVGVRTAFPIVSFQVKPATNINLGVRVGHYETSAAEIEAFTNDGNTLLPIEIRGTKYIFSPGNIEHYGTTGIIHKMKGVQAGEVGSQIENSNGYWTRYGVSSDSSYTFFNTTNLKYGFYFEGIGETVSFLKNGNVGIGRTPTTYKCEISGDLFATGGWLRNDGARGWYNETYGGGIYMTDSTYVRVYNGKSLYVPANIVATGEITAYAPSDIRLKRNVIPISNAMETINRMNPVQFNWNGTAVGLNKEKDEQRLNYGLLAQELEQVLPDLIHTIHGSYKSIDYNGLFAIIIKGLQELNQKVEQWA